MSDSQSFGDQVKKLLAQDPNINELQTKEFRMQLESSLMSWEEKAARVRRALAYMLTILGGTYLIGIFFMPMYSLARQQAADEWMRNLYSFVIAAWVTVGLVSLVVGTYLLFLYLFKYAPALKKARFDVQSAMILELQEQMVQMRQELRSIGK